MRWRGWGRDREHKAAPISPDFTRFPSRAQAREADDGAGQKADGFMTPVGDPVHGRPKRGRLPDPDAKGQTAEPPPGWGRPDGMSENLGDKTF